MIGHGTYFKSTATSNGILFPCTGLVIGYNLNSNHLSKGVLSQPWIRHYGFIRVYISLTG